MTSSPDDPQWTICNDIIKHLKKGLLMPFFGAGVNLTNRPPNSAYEPGGPYLPNASELSEELLREFECDLPNACELADSLVDGARCKLKEHSLLRVSWYVSSTIGKSDLYHHLQRLFGKGSPSDVHEFFAHFRRRLAKKGYEVPQQLIVTTNYDELLERAFKLAGEPYDVFSYTVDSDSELGKFTHTPHGGKPIPIENPSKYVPEIKHTIIFKIHGTAHPTDWEKSTFVITEDDYIDYAAFVRFDNIPSVLANKMLNRRFLYLGYSLSDWNFRVFLRGINARSRFKDKTWAIMHRYDEWDRLYWEEHRVKILQMTLSDHVEILNKIVDEMPGNG